MPPDLGLIIAIVGTGIAMVGVMISLMFWMRQEANGLRAEAKEDRRDFIHLIEAIKEDVRAMQSEMKDFHNQLINMKRKT